MKSLRQLRTSKGLKLSDLEQSLGICISLLSELERGLRQPTKLTRARIEYYFGEQINWLDVSDLSYSPEYPTQWFEVERQFRTTLRMINGLSDDVKGDFIVTSLKHLRKLRNSTVIRSK
jgi:transcriptional regulator with XRE-family HTH domain